MVTIAIPFFNASTYLERAITSVFNQTFTDWQLLLIDDGSTDSSLAIANKYANDRRVTVISDGQNKNLGFRLNQIANLSTTLYLARMDADDIMHPYRIEKQLKVFESHPHIDVLGTNAYSIDENDLVQGIRYMAQPGQELIKVDGFIHPTIMAKTVWFKENPYDAMAKRVEDAELWLRTSSSNKFYVLTEPLLFYREFGSKYYLKYTKGFRSVIYVLKKHSFKFHFIKFALKYFTVGVIYYIFYLFKMESILLNNRNCLKIDNQSIQNFI